MQCTGLRSSPLQSVPVTLLGLPDPPPLSLTSGDLASLRLAQSWHDLPYHREERETRRER